MIEMIKQKKKNPKRRQQEWWVKWREVDGVEKHEK